MTGYDKIKKFVSEVHEINCALTDEIIEFIDEVVLQEQVGNAHSRLPLYEITGCDCLPGTRERIKEAGYIRKSVVEEAEERYEQSKRDFPTPKGVRDLADEYIQELKSEIARLKK